MRSVYQRFALIFMAVGVLIFPTGVQAQIESRTEGIRSFDSRIEIQPSGSLIITETIDFYTPTPRHGIYRQIPYRYNRDGWRFTTRVDQVQVRADGDRVDVEQSTDGKFLELKIGDADETFTGSKQYTIRYRVTQAVQATANNTPELYWDIVGESWQLPIAHTTATVISPSEFTSLLCYSGPFGSDDGECALTPSGSRTIQLQYDQEITYGDNVTVQLGLDPAGLVQAPSTSDRAWWWFKDHWPMALLFVAPGFMLRAYWKHGRDWWYGGSLHLPSTTSPLRQYLPWALPSTPMSYEPPKDVSPGEAGILLNEKSDPTFLVAEILELAHRGHLKVERRDKKKYWFVKLSPKKSALPLNPAQTLLLDGIFASGDEVSLETLKGTFYTTAQKVQQQMEQQLLERGLVVGKPSAIRTKWLILGMVSSGVLCAVAVALLNPFVPLIVIPIEIVALIICFACGWAMPARTAAGSNLAWHIKGLQKTIQRGAWREKIKEKHLFVEEVLPFAVALGVVKQLTRDLKDLNLKPPEYANALVHNGFVSSSLVNSFSSSAASSFAPPSSSSSGWSGGGGSSGGGGGGGGGGSW